MDAVCGVRGDVSRASQQRETRSDRPPLVQVDCYEHPEQTQLPGPLYL